MREQVTDRDALLAILPELRDVRRDRLVEPEAPFLDEPHHGDGRCDDLRERRDIEHGVGRHRLTGRHERAVTERFPIRRVVAPADEHHCPGQLPCLDRGLDDGVDLRETGHVEVFARGRPCRETGGQRERSDEGGGAQQR